MKQLFFIDIISRFQLYSGLSYIFEKINKKNANNDYLIIIFIRFHKTSNQFRVSKEDIKKLELENVIIEFVRERNFERMLKIHINQYRSYSPHIITQMNVSNITNVLFYRFFRKTITNVILQDGIGVIYTNHIWDKGIAQQKKMYPNNFSINIFSTYYSKVKNVFYKIYYSFIKRKIIIYQHDIFHRKNKALEVDENIANTFRGLFKNCINVKYQDTLKDNVLFISDNLGFYLNIIKDETLILAELINTLRENYSGKKIIFKPHPNEIQRIIDYSDLDFDLIINDSISVEEICACFKPCTVVGFCSTALITSSQIFNINTVSMVDLLNDSQLSEYGKNKINQFKNITIALKNLKFDL